MTSSAIALVCMQEWQPLKRKILDGVSTINAALWSREDRENGTYKHHQSCQSLVVLHWLTEMCWKFFGVAIFTSLRRATCSPSHRNIVVPSHSSPDLLQCEEKLPCTGMMHGLKYDKNLSDSSPCVSLHWIAWEPSAASNSMALSEAIKQSS